MCRKDGKGSGMTNTGKKYDLPDQGNIDNFNVLYDDLKFKELFKVKIKGSVNMRDAQ